MTQHHAVVIVGGGPTGLVLAAELALARVDVAIVERRSTQELDSARAGGLHARTLEVLDQRGVVERFVALGQKMQIQSFGGPLDISDAPTRHGYTLALGQRHIERLLADWVAELGVPTYRPREVSSFREDDSGVEVALSDGSHLRAQYLAGCDGGRSTIRKHAGIELAGWDATTSYLLAEAELTEEPAWGLRRTERGSNGIGKLDDGRARIVLVEDRVNHGEPTLDELRAALVALYGSDFGVHDVTWLSRFSDAARQATRYRAGRVLLAGDAAHIHSPVGGQGLNTGVQDAVNLGWKLAQVVHGTSPDSLLDTYHAERHPVGARVLRTTMALTALHRGDDATKALSDAVTELVAMDEPRRRFGAKLVGLDIHYDLGAGHPLLGRRMPDLSLASGARVSSLLHAARPVLLELTGAALDVGPWADRVRVVHDRIDAVWELPALGVVPAPRAVLIRPDGHAAWVGDGRPAGLTDALARWFGPAVRG